jgi:hypothetical protein
MTDEQTKAWQGLVLVIVGAIAYYSGALDEILDDFGFETVSVQAYMLIDKGEEKYFENVSEIEIGNQQRFTEFVNSHQIEAEKQKSDAQKKYVWIQANKKLCAGILVLPNENLNWVGKIMRISARDNGDIGLTVRISHGIDVTQSIRSSEMKKIALPLIEGEFVRFSGFFSRGDMSQNECIATTGMFSAPEILRETYKFKFTKIEKLAVKIL